MKDVLRRESLIFLLNEVGLREEVRNLQHLKKAIEAVSNSSMSEEDKQEFIDVFEALIEDSEDHGERISSLIQSVSEGFEAEENEMLVVLLDQLRMEEIAGKIYEVAQSYNTNPEYEQVLEELQREEERHKEAIRELLQRL